MKAKKEVNISANIPIELAQKLKKVADFEERSKSFYIKKSLNQFLDQKLEDMEDYLSAKKILQEIKEGKEELVTFEEVFKDVD